MLRSRMSAALLVPLYKCPPIVTGTTSSSQRRTYIWLCHSAFTWYFDIEWLPVVQYHILNSPSTEIWYDMIWYTVIPRLTKIIRSGITFVSRNVILYKLCKYIIHFILLNWKYVHNVFTILLPDLQSLFKVSSWNGPTVHVCCFMLARASTKTFVSRIHIR